VKSTKTLFAAGLVVLSLGSAQALATAAPVAAKTASSAYSKHAQRRAAQRRARHHRARLHARRARQHAREHNREQVSSRPRTNLQQAGQNTTSGSAATSTTSTVTLLATPCLNTEITPEESNIDLVREAILCLINKVRVEHGEQLLTDNSKLDAAAVGHSSELVAKDYFEHVAPDGTTPVDRIRDDGYIPGPSAGYVLGENLAWGTYNLATPQSIVNAWLASPGHLANILEARYRDTGIGVTAAVPPSLGEGAPGATYAQEFGVIVQ
jgi:uncharacterized protein YkwD